MPRIQTHDYSHPSYHPASNSTAIPSSLRSGFSSASRSVSVVVRNRPAATDNVSASSVETPGGADIRGNDPQESGDIIGSDLYYAPMPMGVAQPSERNDTSALMSGSTNRGTKRGHSGDDELDGDNSRQHRRLTTKEEVALFDICNQNADTFGSRSNLCKWWISIAAEFKRTHDGRSYSWHSVRRKVEMVTRQRIKFLEDQRQRGSNAPGSTAEELMNPQWLAAVDAWIPTWQRWEEAENRRIAKRDELKKRRQPQPWRQNPKNGDQDPWRNLPRSSVTSPTDAGTAMMGVLHQPGASSVVDATVTASPTPSPSVTGPGTHVHFLEPPSTPISTPTSMKLPPGFENMFSIPQVPPQATPVTTVSAPPVSQSDGRMVSAVLETLGKLNKHLDAASGGDADTSTTSPVISALVQAASESSTLASPGQSKHPSQPPSPQSPTAAQIEQMKEELRNEMQAQFRRELERERTAMEEKLDALQRTQDLILEMLRQEPA
ncbi:hypothetical protein N7457_000986 [Penicillium paradoxum]|uniref:uncharacterized protein n=1 Tax=Penicillium paradoxum TaxID=176176 RepID=UPI0025474A73|nr:uncharacterized protein N7457_000986 [Penicillium paradoxum]KAJ5794387.1 hypothetical protein N7457_000986 [Penicillium paradoxum]